MDGQTERRKQKTAGEKTARPQMSPRRPLDLFFHFGGANPGRTEQGGAAAYYSTTAYVRDKHTERSAFETRTTPNQTQDRLKNNQRSVYGVNVHGKKKFQPLLATTGVATLGSC